LKKKITWPRACLKEERGGCCCLVLRETWRLFTRVARGTCYPAERKGKERREVYLWDKGVRIARWGGGRTVFLWGFLAKREREEKGEINFSRDRVGGSLTITLKTRLRILISLRGGERGRAGLQAQAGTLF